MKSRIMVLVLIFSAVSCDLFMEEPVDVTYLYGRIHSGKIILEQRTGEPYELNASSQICMEKKTPTEYKKYYELKYTDPYYSYGRSSAYASDLQKLVMQMDDVMNTVYESGFFENLQKTGHTPALMFDIDNTVEFSAGPDDDKIGEGPAVVAVRDFARQHCFHNGMVCYFITARPCQQGAVSPTIKWVKNELGLSDEQIQRYVHFSGSLTGCSINGESVAYKDVIRQALAETENIYWLMSIGDQLTDSLGRHSGVKVRVPNQFFHSDMNPNQFAPWGRGKCESPHTVAPDQACYEKLKDVAISHTGVEFCGACTDPDGCM